MLYEELSLPLQPLNALYIWPADCTYSSLVHATVFGLKTGKKSELCHFISGAWGDFYDLMEQAQSAVC